MDIISRTIKSIFIPLTVGGGLRTIDDIRTVLRAGADKVSLNTAAINSPELISEAARRFGSSTITVSIEAIRKPDGSYEAYTDNGRERTGVDPFNWAIRAAELGAGELIVTSIDQEGTGKGFDIDLIRGISESVPIPVIACGGAGRVNDIYDAAVVGRANAVCVASVLHYDFLKTYQATGESYEEGNIEYLKSGRAFSNIQSAPLPDIKAYLLDHDIACRPAKGSIKV